MYLPSRMREAVGGPSHVVSMDSRLDPSLLDPGPGKLLIQNQIYLELSPPGLEMLFSLCMLHLATPFLSHLFAFLSPLLPHVSLCPSPPDPRFSPSQTANTLTVTLHQNCPHLRLTICGFGPDVKYSFAQHSPFYR